MAISKSKKNALNNVMSKIKKQFGDDAINQLSEIEDSLRVTYHKTPSYELNTALGGGFAKGRIVEVYGREGSGKTSLILEQIAKDMKEDPEFMACWVETEGSLNPDDCKKFGIDMDRFVFLEQSDDLTAESCMDIIRSLISSGEFSVVCLNSVAALTPKAESEADFDKAGGIALQARLLSKFLRVTTGILTKNKCTLFLVNQIRTNLSGSARPGMILTTTSGGMAIPFYASQRIEMKKEKVMAADPIGEEEGLKIRCRIIKNRLAKEDPFKTCYYYARYKTGIDGTLELATVLPREGIVTKKGAWIRYENEEGDVMNVPSNDGEVEGKWNGASAFSSFLEQNKVALDFFVNLLEQKIESGSLSKTTSLSEEEIQEILNQEKEIELNAEEIQDVE